MAKFTPGPWEHDAAHSNSDETCIDTTARPAGPVALVYPVEGISAPERMANARLIAAAPEMYELLQELLGHWSAYSEPEWGDGMHAFYCLAKGAAPRWEQARALLARIDGESDD